MYWVRSISDVEYCTRENSRANVSGTVRYLTSIIALEKIFEPMYYVRPKFDVDYYTRENRQADVFGSSNIRCRLLH